MSRSSKETLRLSDLNGTSDLSTMPITFGEERKGCFVSVITGFVLVMLAVVLAVGVGLIVHFASPSRHNVECTCQFQTFTSNVATSGENYSQQQLKQQQQDQQSQLWRECEELAAKNNRCIITSGCPEHSLGLPTSPPTRKPYPKDVRLPLHVYPIHYNLELQPLMYEGEPANFTFNGTVQILLNCTSPTDVITLHANKLTIVDSSVKLTGANGGGSEVEAPEWLGLEKDEVRQFIKLHLEAQLTVGQLYTLEMSFSGELNDDLVGLYRSSYKEDNHTKWLATTQMQPTDARRAFPCFDEPAVKSTFNITLVRRPHMKALSNMPLETTEDRPDGWKADHFAPTVKMSTYLLAFVVCEMEYKEKDTASGIKFRVWARRDAINQVDYALDTGVKIIEFFEEFFNISFPLPKQDMVAVPDFSAGAMENWGLIMYRETALLFDELISSAGNKQRVAVVVSHELAHQWFGNLVTMDWWDDLWLNEGFASWVEYLGVDHVSPDWKAMDQFVVVTVQAVFRTDSLGSSHPIYIPVSHPDEINEIFDGISYKKGGSVIRMMNHFLGPETFRKGLTKYLQKHSYGNAHHKDLWRILTEQARADGNSVEVDDVMDTWLLQMGYPVVTFHLDPSDPTTATVTQEHFLLDPRQTPDQAFTSRFGYKWVIPLTYTQSSNVNWENPSRTWMHLSNVSVPVDPEADWLLGNVGQYGYYRVNYPTENWRKLIKQLNDDHLRIPVKNRAQIIDDAFNLGRSGRLDQVWGLRATEYLSLERDYIPWEAASSNLGYIATMLQRSYAYGRFQEYLLKQILPIYNWLGWHSNPSDPHLQKYLRTIAVGYACDYGHQECLQNASALYRRWMEDPVNNRISASLTSTMYCNGIKAGGQEEWEFAYEQYQHANVAAEKLRLLYAMTCTREPWLLSRYLQMSLDKNLIRKADMSYVLIYTSRNPIGRSMAWDFLRANLEKLQDYFMGGFSPASQIIQGISDSFNTEFELEQLTDFKRQNQAILTGGTRAMDQAIESTTVNVQWMKDNEDTIAKWLDDVLRRK